MYSIVLMNILYIDLLRTLNFLVFFLSTFRIMGIKYRVLMVDIIYHSLINYILGIFLNVWECPYFTKTTKNALTLLSRHDNLL